MKLIIAANWKMHKTAAATAAFCQALRRDEALFEGVDVLVCPPFTSLPAASAGLEGSTIKIGAQNMHSEEKGAYTGEIAAAMLVEFGVRYVIIGHSERRHLMGETDQQVSLKVRAALATGLQPILCLGETESEREQGQTAAVIKRQLTAALEGLAAKDLLSLVVAYEPVWAIGTGKAASADDAEDAAALVYRLAAEHFGAESAKGLRVQYGGSVKAENIGSYMALPSVSGALVGGASLEAESFSALIQAARKAVLH
ncbi:MAG: triose-phosphate isomerase [Firmicutes bacterium]|nr:triose-phosphate isomerase [Bacillota bacterium]